MVPLATEPRRASSPNLQQSGRDWHEVHGNPHPRGEADAALSRLRACRRSSRSATRSGGAPAVRITTGTRTRRARCCAMPAKALGGKRSFGKELPRLLRD